MATHRQREAFDFNLKDATAVDKLEPHVVDHLKKVYSTLAVGTAICGLGAYLAVQNALPFFLASEFLNMLMTIGLIIGLTMYRGNDTMQFGMYSGAAFLMGASMDSLMTFAFAIDPWLPLQALGLTAVVFGSFTFAALTSSNKREFLYLGGMLYSGLNLLLLLGFLNIFFGSKLLWNINLYGGLILFVGYVMFDTQFIIARRRMGDDDHYMHALTLLLDAINLFRRILIILSENRRDDRRRR